MGTPGFAKSVAIGDVLGDKYRVDSVIGSGGTATVYAATHRQLLQKVAVKVLRRHQHTDPNAETRFLREARALVALRSEHVARVFDVGTTDNGAPYLVMEHLEGGDLSQKIKNGNLEPYQAATLIAQACEAVAEAHGIGIVHRDLKPHNMFLVEKPGQRPLLKVLDFGIAKVDDPAMTVESGITASVMFLGTPAYMAPEQLASSRSVDARADVWALGICLYECLSGKVPFDEENALVLGAMVMSKEVPHLTTHRKDLPVEIVDIVHKCLRKNPDERYRDAAELQVALRGFLDEADQTSTDEVPVAVPQVAQPTVDPPAPPFQGGIIVPPAASAPAPMPRESYASGSSLPPPGGPAATSASGRSAWSVIFTIVGAILLGTLVGMLAILAKTSQAANVRAPSASVAASESAAASTVAGAAPSPSAPVARAPAPSASVPTVPPPIASSATPAPTHANVPKRPSSPRPAATSKNPPASTGVPAATIPNER